MKIRLLIAFAIFVCIGANAQSQNEKTPETTKHHTLKDIRWNFTNFPKDPKAISADWKKFNQDELNNPDIGKQYIYSPDKNYVEVLDRRTEFSKYYVNPKNPNEFYVQKGHEPLHMWENNQWVTIDPRLRPQGDGVYEATNQWTPVGFDVYKKMSYLKLKQGVIYFNDWSLFGEDSNGVTTCLGKANWTDYSVGADGIYVYDVFPGMDAEMFVGRGIVKTSFIVHSIKFPGYNKLLFKDVFHDNLNTHLAFNDGSTNGTRSGVLYLNGDDNYLKIEHAYMFLKGVPASQAKEVPYSINGNEMKMVVDMGYLKKNITLGDVMIDPLVSSSNSVGASSIGSMYNSSCNYTNSCDYTMTVSTPPAATITDVLYSFAIQASAPCGMNSGVFSFTSGSCFSGYWGCGGTGPGACGGTISIYGAMSSCMPAPKCTAQDVTFGLHMYRKCVGPTGCDNTCYFALWPWTMIIKGHTVEYSKGDTAIVASDSAICAGGTINFTLNDTAKYGIGPYTTPMWSFDSSATIVLDSGYSLTYTFPTAGTYTLYATAHDSCGNTAIASKTIIVYPIPAVSSVTKTGPTHCRGSDGSIVFKGLSASTTYYIAYTDDGTIINDTLVSDGTGAVTLSNLNAGTYDNFSFMAHNCTSSVTYGPYVLSDPPRPNNPTIANGSPVCEGVSLTVSASSSSSPVYYTWYGPGSFSSISSAFTINPTALTDSGMYYVYVKDSNDCYSDTISTDVVIKPLPANPTASSNSPVCQGSTLNLTANCSTAAVNYAWTGPNFFSAPTQNPSLTNVQLNAAGTYKVYSYLNGCRSVSPATTDVYVKWTPGTPTASNNSPICSGMGYNTNTLILSSSDTSAGVTFTWSGPNGFSVSNSSSATQLRTNPPSADAGTYTVYATLNGCTSASTTTDVKITPTPSSPVVSPSTITYCQYDTVSALIATGDSLRWHLLSTGTSDSGTFTPPVPNSSIPGIYKWYVTQTKNGCESPSSLNTVIVKLKPMTPYLGADSMYTYCQGDNATRLRATGVNLLWYTTATGGTGDPVAPVPSTATAGDFYYYVSQTVNGCESDRARVHILVKQKPAAPSVSVVTYCQGDVATPLSAGGANLLWYTVPSGGIGSPVSPTPLTSYADTIHYFVTQTVNGCESDRAELLVVVNYTPNAVIVASQPYVCQFDTMSFKYFGNGKADATYNWTMPTGASIVGGIGQGPIVVRFDSFGHRNVLLLVDNKGCKSPLTSYTVDVRQAPDVPLKSNSNICQGQTLDLSLGYPNEPLDGYKWDFDNGNIVYGSNGSGPYGIEWDIAGPKYVKLVVYSNECHSRDIIDTVQVHPLGDAHIQSVSSNNICAGDTVVFTAERYNPAYLYQWLPATYFTNSTNQQEVKGLIGQSGYIKLQVTTEYGCVSIDSTLIAAQPCCEMYFPNAFTPNGDGRNDIFRPIVRGNQQMKTFRVINRWGQVMFETTDQHMGWDGKLNGVPQDLGTYYYYVEYTCANGKVYKEKGELVLLR